MTYHIITITQPGSRLSVDRGFLVCKTPDNNEKRIALADVRAIVVGVPSVAYTNTCIARLLAQDSPILHCNEHFKPIGWSVALHRVIRKEVFANQLQNNAMFNKILWKQIVLQKMKNQAALLDHFTISHPLTNLIERPLPNEANIARQYWKLYFQLLENPQNREQKGSKSFENKALNYGYAVISTLVHRAILIYGLLPILGIHHSYRYRSTPLVYDLMEPFRAFVELALATWVKQLPYQPETETDFKEWIEFLMGSLNQCRIKHPKEKHSHKLLDAIDKMVASVASCFESVDFTNPVVDRLWVPQLNHHYWLSSDKAEENDEECV